MTTTIECGRLCNQLIRNLAHSFIAKKHDLLVQYSSYNKIKSLGIDLFIGKKIYNSFIELNDDNYFSILNSNTLTSNLDGKYKFFQTREIITMIYDHLNSENNKQKIMSLNPYKHLYNNNNDCYVHVRLGDVEHHSPGIKYYLKALSLIFFDKLYISSDSPDHNIIKEIMNEYTNSEIIYEDEVKTIQLASTCRHLVLSHGSFSSLIGYLGYYSTVYYPPMLKEEGRWYGDLFVIPNWIVVL
jgi:hypothetical protein